MKFGADDGLYRHDLFQVAYVTNDIERALQVFADRYGVKEWRRMEGDLKEGGHIRVEFGWAGGSLAALPRDSIFGLEVPLRSEAEAGVGPRERLSRCIAAAQDLMARLD